MDKEWYYTIDQSDQQGPISEDELKHLYAQGTIKKTDLIWKNGMTDWVAAGTWPAFGGTGTENRLPRHSAPSEPLPSGLSGWLTFVGVMNIIVGALNIVSCFGIIFGILMLIAGAALLGAKTALHQAEMSMPPYFLIFQQDKDLPGYDRYPLYHYHYRGHYLMYRLFRDHSSFIYLHDGKSVRLMACTPTTPPLN